MQLVTRENKITRAQLAEYSQRMFGGLVKAVVDVEQGTMLVDAEMHADLEAELLKCGSQQDNLWGINFYPAETGEDFLEFDSMINIRPRQNNRSRSVEDKNIQEEIRSIVTKLVI